MKSVPKTLWAALVLSGTAAIAGAAMAQTASPPPPGPENASPPPSIYGPPDSALRSAPAGKGKVWLLPATIDTTQWGWFDNAQPPVLRVHSGDTVVMETMMHSHNQV